MAEAAATRSAALALADERALMQQGYRFLDEKRMLLAAEVLRGLARHGELQAQLVRAMQPAQSALRQALQRHGLEGLQAYPPSAPVPEAPRTERSSFLGVALRAATMPVPPPAGPDKALDASPEAQACGAAFQALLDLLARLGASAGNLERLAAEYRRTERRARALENVLLPEIERALRTTEEHLEQADREEAVRIRTAAQRSLGKGR